jgi:acyl-CoA thioester hydrolase
MLVNLKETEVRFSEVDSMGIVWHGHYVKYFEDGREAFGREYGLGYLEVYEKGFFVPIVNVNCSYKRPIRYNEPLLIETRFVDTPAAKIIFKYTLYNKQNSEVYATGSSEQVFLTKERELHLTVPDFFVRWKKERGITTS